MLKIVPVRALTDNYIWFIVNESNRTCILFDPGSASCALDYIHKNNLSLAALLVTHHHYDHVDGLAAILQEWQVPAYLPEKMRNHFGQIVSGGDFIKLDAIGLSLSVMATPGHTQDHLVYYVEGNEAHAPWLFSGDLLFSAGCGRVFDGDYSAMHDSLMKVAALPDATQVFSAHEYTQSCLDFAETVEPLNEDIQNYRRFVVRCAEKNRPTVPTSIGLEKKINPFLRVQESSVIRAVTNHCGKEPKSDIEVFEWLRRWKDAS